MMAWVKGYQGGVPSTVVIMYSVWGLCNKGSDSGSDANADYVTRLMYNMRIYAAGQLENIK